MTGLAIPLSTAVLLLTALDGAAFPGWSRIGQPRSPSPRPTAAMRLATAAAVLAQLRASWGRRPSDGPARTSRQPARRRLTSISARSSASGAGRREPHGREMENGAVAIDHLPRGASEPGAALSSVRAVN